MHPRGPHLPQSCRLLTPGDCFRGPEAVPPGTRWACAEQTEDWVTGHRYLDISELRQWQSDHAPKEVALTAIS